MPKPMRLERLSSLFVGSATCQQCGATYAPQHSSAAFQLYFCGVDCEMLFSYRIVEFHTLDLCVQRWRGIEDS